MASYADNAPAIVAEGRELVRLTSDAAADWRTVAILNRYDADEALHGDNRAWLAERDGLEVVTSVEELAIRLS